METHTQDIVFTTSLAVAATQTIMHFRGCPWAKFRSITNLFHRTIHLRVFQPIGGWLRKRSNIPPSHKMKLRRSRLTHYWDLQKVSSSTDFCPDSDHFKGFRNLIHTSHWEFTSRHTALSNAHVCRVKDSWFSKPFNCSGCNDIMKIVAQPIFITTIFY